MSTCPSNNIHSLYVDNELNQSLRHNFENHLNSCDTCKKQVAQYLEMRNKLQSLNEQIDVEEGFERLKTRFSYKTNIAPHRTLSFAAFVLKLSPVLAAVAIFALFVPLINSSVDENIATHSYSNSSLNEYYVFPSSVSNEVAPMQQKGVVVEDAITLSRINSKCGKLYAVEIDPGKFIEMDVFMPANIKESDFIDIILFDTPSLVLHETDDFGFSHPVFLLRE